MRLEFDTSAELTNTQFAPVAALMAYYEAQKVLEPLQSVTSGTHKGDFTLAEKLERIIAGDMDEEWMIANQMKHIGRQAGGELHRVIGEATGD